MDYGRILSRAWEIIWRWKTLWILGFLVALGTGGNVDSVNYRFLWDDLWSGRYNVLRPGPEVTIPLAVFGCLAILIALAIWIVSIIARGGLIAGVQQVEAEGSTSFRRAWRRGVHCFWSLFVIRLLLGIAILVLALVLVGIIVLIALSSGISFGRGGPDPDMAWQVILPLILCGVPLCCIGVIIGTFLGVIVLYAERAVVLEDMGTVDALSRSWSVLRENVGPTVLLWLIFLAIGIGVSIAVGVVLLIISAPFIAIFANTRPSWWWIAPIVGTGLVTLIISATIRSILEAFTSATWTLAYSKLVGLELSPKAES